MVGTGTAYARDDHDHGLPAAPAGIPITAETSSTGVALINGTQTILTATVPNDGKPHTLIYWYIKHVITAITGGAVAMDWTSLIGTAYNDATSVVSVSYNYHPPATAVKGTHMNVKPGATVTFNQTSAMTAGAAKVYAKIVIL